MPRSDGSDVPTPVRLVLLGASGNSREILDTLLAINQAAGRIVYECVGVLDDALAGSGSRFRDIPVLGPLEAARGLSGVAFVNGIGSPASFRTRSALLGRAGVPLERFATIVHPTAVVAASARLGHGVVLLSHVSIGSNAGLEDDVMVLPNSVVSHDATIGRHTCVASGVCISGGVRVGLSCYLGANASLIGNIEIGEGALVGMGSTVLRSVPPGAVVAGTPARVLKSTPSEPLANRPPL